MPDTQPKNSRLIAIFFFGALLLTYPILSLFDYPTLVFGIPLLYLYLFTVWAGLIGLTLFITQVRTRTRHTGNLKRR